MKDLPTAEELFKKYSWTAKLDGETLKVVDRQDFLKAIKLYAKLHVEAALKAASERYEYDERLERLKRYGEELDRMLEDSKNNKP